METCQTPSLDTGPRIVNRRSICTKHILSWKRTLMKTERFLILWKVWKDGTDIWTIKKMFSLKSVLVMSAPYVKYPWVLLLLCYMRRSK